MASPCLYILFLDLVCLALVGPLFISISPLLPLIAIKPTLFGTISKDMCVGSGDSKKSRERKSFSLMALLLDSKAASGL